MIGSLAFSMLIETSSWALRGKANQNNIGLFIGRTNIYLYGARLLQLIFSVGLAHLVDQSTSLHEICILVFISYLTASIIHLVFLKENLNLIIMNFLSRFLNLPIERKKNKRRIFFLRSFFYM